MLKRNVIGSQCSQTFSCLKPSKHSLSLQGELTTEMRPSYKKKYKSIMDLTLKKKQIMILRFLQYINIIITLS